MPFLNCACGRRIETKPEWAGRRVRCPKCASVLQVPAPGVTFEEPPAPAAPGPDAAGVPPAPATKACPYCAETIKAEAIKCPFCRESLAGGGRPQGARIPRRKPVDDGTNILIVAILGWAVCGILHPIAWSMGHSREIQCRAQGITPSSATHAGKILGMIGTCIMAFGLVAVLLIVLAGGLK